MAPMIYYTHVDYLGRCTYKITFFTKPYPNTVPAKITGGKEVGRAYDAYTGMDMAKVEPEEDGGTYYVEAL